MILLFRDVNGHGELAGKALKVSSEEEVVKKIYDNAPQYEKYTIDFSDDSDEERKSVLAIVSDNSRGILGWLYPSEAAFIKHLGEGHLKECLV